NGSAPASAQMIELGWASVSDIFTTADPRVESSLIALRPEQTIHARILGLTGIPAAELAAAPTEDDVRQSFLASLPPDPVFVAHYARFERGFLAGFIPE